MMKTTMFLILCTLGLSIGSVARADSDPDRIDTRRLGEHDAAGVFYSPALNKLIADRNRAARFQRQDEGEDGMFGAHTMSKAEADVMIPIIKRLQDKIDHLNQLIQTQESHDRKVAVCSLYSMKIVWATENLGGEAIDAISDAVKNEYKSLTAGNGR